jgi:hypothetical protein
MATLKLGSTDQGKIPADKSAFFKPYHTNLVASLTKLQFRGEKDKEWVDFTEVSGTPVQTLQDDLRTLGFPPETDHNGIFGYGTRAAARLFQEYVRHVEGNPAIGVPDGVVGPKTQEHLARWKQEGKKSEWSNPTITSAYQEWLGVLENMKTAYLQQENPVIQKVIAFNQPTDTLKPADWKTTPDVVHLIGIRSSGGKASKAIEANEDLFFLLLNGRVFQFWGSTSPNRGMSEMDTIPFLLEGQHRYRFGWHKVKKFLTEGKIYPALRPSDGKGVLVVRDRNKDNAMTDEEIAVNPLQANGSINIHWSGDGHANWSAGCQVIAGKSYRNPEGKRVDCSPYSASGYKDLGNGKTRGAYNVLADLILTYAPLGTQHVYYSLIHEKRLQAFKTLNATALLEELKKTNVA